MELRPRWLPLRMFQLLMERWRHPDRAARCASGTYQSKQHCAVMLMCKLLHCRA